ncbi:WXG100 family type VII secretion target [Mumia sp. ZJ430]|uniref:WXG100 family type VII secretion target n=1 Tax=Mumia sp. ZJ430 TaxID=2708083 RepID=UPI001AB05884|nr:WXG100 family type VII secretion target [Mumia sp. ZJ430]
MVAPTEASYPALGFDPTPGDADAVEATAATLKQAAGSLSSAADQLWGAAEGEWRGTTATEFRTLLDTDLRPPVVDASGALDAAATTLSGWAGDLEEFQRRARGLEKEAAQAEADSAAAQGTLDGLPQPRPSWEAPPTEEADRRAERDDARSRSDAQKAKNGADGRLADCRRRARLLHDEYEAAARTAGNTLKKSRTTTPPARLGDVDDDLAGTPPLPYPYNLAFLTPEQLDEYARKHPSRAADVIEYRLRSEGLLVGPEPGGLYRRWLENAARRGVSPSTMVDVARTHDIDPEDFTVLDGLEEVRDGDQSYFLLPTTITADQARAAVLMTYILNAGSNYGLEPGVAHDFPPTPFSSAEIQRIIDRQKANSWSYDDDVEFVNGNGGRLATTPNGMLMGLGGNWLQDAFSFSGGTAWGDTFMFNIDSPEGDDAAEQLRKIIVSGHSWGENDDGPFEGQLDLDRLLHHEERHSQQWAEMGHLPFLDRYLGEGLVEWVRDWSPLEDKPHPFEEDAGLGDGGYH